jgi:DNA recombination protein RmuC
MEHMWLVVACVAVVAFVLGCFVGMRLMKQMSEGMREQMLAHTEKILKEREAELDRKARETFDGISGRLGENIKNMKEAFELNKKVQTESSEAFKEKLDNAVKSLQEQSMSIGSKADNLADALRGKNKTQGCWGEVVLDNLFRNEGLKEGRDYDREETLRDELGQTVLNEDSAKKMRPDFILHYPNDNDLVVDAKVSLTAFSDYLSADDEVLKNEALARHLKSVKDQVDRLAAKDYARYLKKGRRMLDYVIMFVPNYSALRLAYEADEKLWQYAYSKGVLIATEETLMPFLRMINIAWTSHEQVRNQEKIVAAAENILARVSDFAVAHARMGKKLEEAMDHYEECDKKIRDRGQSIVVAANKLVEYGVPKNPKKPLPSVRGSEE